MTTSRSAMQLRNAFLLIRVMGGGQMSARATQWAKADLRGRRLLLNGLRHKKGLFQGMLRSYATPCAKDAIDVEALRYTVLEW